MASALNTNHLFGIPREIRNCIYKMVLLSENKAPESPGDRNRCGPLPRLPQSNVGGLLACNQQLRQEVIETISYVNIGSELQIKMDTITWGTESPESQVTWLLVPAPMKYIRQMIITSRIAINTDWESQTCIHHALETGFFTILGLFLQVFGKEHIFGSRRSRDTTSCYPLHLGKLFLNVTFMHDKSKLKEHDYPWLQGCTVDFLEDYKEVFNNNLCNMIDHDIRANSYISMTDQIVLRYDHFVTTWQLLEDPKRE
ncbi:hypothetical protein G7Y79_00002g008280 [Physcia stellaris]|nr:hypothetical protein G7Y79_00002g008280 [Physcia stellaris]